MFSLAVVGGIGFLPVWFCRSSDRYTAEELQKKDNGWTTLFGQVYDFDKLPHPEGINGTRGTKLMKGKDATKLFPRVPIGLLPQYCKNSNKLAKGYYNDLVTPNCSQLTPENITAGLHCHTRVIGKQSADNAFKKYRQGTVVMPTWDLASRQGMEWIRIGKSIYNVTEYINALRDPETLAIDTGSDHPHAYLNEKLHQIVVNKRAQDATDLFNLYFPISANDTDGIADQRL